ncbi:MAG: hypothetical protein VX624_14830 [Pseudomonadota bacterium]|nr:hypothetical protein [Pseudomonadota bacterium]
MVVQGRVKNAMPLAVNRVFGNPKFTAAPLLTGAILDLYDWKWAFIIPGVFSIAASIAYSFFFKAGDKKSLYPTEAAANKGAAISIDRGVVIQVFAIIFFTTELGGHLPKHELRDAEFLRTPSTRYDGLPVPDRRLIGFRLRHGRSRAIGRLTSRR